MKNKQISKRNVFSSRRNVNALTSGGFTRPSVARLVGTYTDESDRPKPDSTN